MRKILVALLFFIICFALFLSVGMGTIKNNPNDVELRPPGIFTPQEVFAKSTSDIFLFRGIIYTNASDIDWVNKLNITVGKEVGEITQVYKKGDKIEGVVSTKLPVGTKIYEPIGPNELILIVKLNNKEIRFLGLVEG